MLSYTALHCAHNRKLLCTSAIRPLLVLAERTVIMPISNHRVDRAPLEDRDYFMVEADAFVRSVCAVTYLLMQHMPDYLQEDVARYMEALRSGVDVHARLEKLKQHVIKHQRTSHGDALAAILILADECDNAISVRSKARER